MNYTQAPILSAEQIRQWDIYTTQEKNIVSTDLMETAAAACLQWLEENNYLERSFSIFCGKGNNGGDGLALARMLSGRQCNVVVYILEFGHAGTVDFQANLMLLHQTPVEIVFIQQEENIHPIREEDVIIDALFGSGLNRPLEGVTRTLVQHINSSGNEVIAIDIPSGMFADSSSAGFEVIKAVHTLSFQACKLAFLLPENAAYTGAVHIIDIGLSPSFLTRIIPSFELVNSSLAKSIYRPRKEYAHKGDFGHASLIAGSENMMGAAILCAKACLRSGVGKLTCCIPPSCYPAMNIAAPESIVSTEIYVDQFDAIGIGPGIGTGNGHKKLIKELFKTTTPLVIDADALNILSQHSALLKEVSALSILTPHPKEFERLFGKSANDFERLEKAKQNAKELNVIIVLKGHHSFIAMPGGKAYFNTTGNAGMATAGSGDVLTGIITGLLAQRYTPEEAALLGVYLHGKAGDIAAGKYSEEAIIASDIIENLGDAFKSCFYTAAP